MRCGKVDDTSSFWVDRWSVAKKGDRSTEDDFTPEMLSSLLVYPYLLKVEYFKTEEFPRNKVKDSATLWILGCVNFP